MKIFLLLFTALVFMLAMQGSLESFVKLFFDNFGQMLECCIVLIVWVYYGRRIEIWVDMVTVWIWIGAKRCWLLIQRFGRWGHSV